MLYEQDFGVSSSKTFYIFFPVCKNVFIIIVADGVGGAICLRPPLYGFRDLRPVYQASMTNMWPPESASQPYIVFPQILNHNLKDFLKIYISHFIFSLITNVIVLEFIGHFIWLMRDLEFVSILYSQ